MKCQEFEQLVTDLARRDLLDTTEQERAQAHAELCTACRALLAAHESLTSDLRETAVSMEELSAPLRVEGQLRAAFRQQAVGPPERVLPDRPRGSWLANLAATGMVAVLALAVLLLVRDPLPAPQQQTSLASETPEPRLPAGLGAGREVATDFFPLGYAESLVAPEPYHLVRVKLPRSALLYFGLPAGDVAGERVAADVLVGADGTAQAVRFLRGSDGEGSLLGY